MNATMRSFVMGMLPGAVSRAQFPAAQPEQPEKEPIGFLYGHVAGDGETPTHTIDGEGYVGAVLPKLPEAEGYSYRLLRVRPDAGTRTYVVFYGENPSVIDTSANGFTIAGKSTYVMYWSDDTWATSPYLTDQTWPLDEGDTIVWANHKVYTTDGTLYLEASDPIPVYE